MSKAHPTRLSEAAASYLQYRKNRNYAPGTMAADERVLRSLERSLGDMQIRNITPQHLTDWFFGPGGQRDVHTTFHYGRRRIQQGISDATYNQYRDRLKVFFAWCTRQGILKADLLQDCPYLKVRKRRRRQPPPEVLLGFLDSAENARDRAYLAFAVNTALRASEICRVKIIDLIDLDDGWVYIDLSKGGEEQHRQPVTSELDRELRAWLKVYASDIGRPLRDDDMLFPSRTSSRIIGQRRNPETGKSEVILSERHWQPQEPMKRSELIVQKALKASGVEDTRYEGTHTIRRAVARAYFDSMRSEMGRDNALRVVSALLHHASTANTERYLGLSSETEVRDDMLRGKPFLSTMVKEAEIVPLRAV